MSQKSNKRLINLGKLLGILLFVGILFTNITFLSKKDAKKGTVAVLGIELTLFEPTLANTENPYCYWWSTSLQDCIRPPGNCLCDVVVTP